MNRIKKLYQKLFDPDALSGKQQGAALIVTLLVMMVLVLLALSLILQSQTEYTIAVNEQDAFTALGYGEATLDWLNKRVRDYALDPSNPTDLDDFLNGANNGSATDDHLPDFGPERTLDLSGLITLDNMVFANETTTAVLVQKDFDGNGLQDYEAFRVGDDTDHDGDFDGNTRGLVYVRVDDNFDTGTTPDIDDDDWRMRARIIAEYPRFINADGTLKSGTEDKQLRTVAQRKLVANFAPAGVYAIRAQGDIEIEGSLQICGECGGAHANGTLTVNLSGADAYNCAEVSGTDGLNITNTTGLKAPATLTGPIFIPVLNPYDDRFVPAPTTFDHHADAGLLPQLQCPGPTVTDPNYLTVDPGASKYFALSMRKTTVGDDNQMRIYKAYWDNTNLHWVWRLIDEGSGNSPNLNAVLDNCGRLVSATLWDDDGDATNNVALQPDPMPAAGDPYWGGGGKPLSAGVGVTDAANDFYGFKMAHNQGYDLDGCDNEQTLAGTNFNDFTLNDYWRTYPNPFTDFTDIKSDDYTRNASALLGSYTDPYANTVLPGATPDAINQGNATFDPPLPGTVRTYLTALAIPDANADNGVTPASARRDFDYTLANGQTFNSTKWSFKGTPSKNVLSPMWGAVLFLYGNVDTNSGSNLVYMNDAGVLTSLPFSDPQLDNRWRISFIVYNYMELHGNPIYGPANISFPYTVVAGRDISMHGTGGADHGGQDTCPAGTDCTADPASTNGFEGMILAHEDVLFTGNVQVDGFIVAEDASTCINHQVDPNEAGGSVQIHYDCNNPPDPWGDKSVRIASWEEVQ